MKTDLQDVKSWAERLLVNDIKAAWVPPAPVRELRGLIAYRKRQVAMGTRLKNRLQSLLQRNQIVPLEGRIFASKHRE